MLSCCAVHHIQQGVGGGIGVGVGRKEGELRDYSVKVLAGFGFEAVCVAPMFNQRRDDQNQR